jgi:hypothetical protein
MKETFVTSEPSIRSLQSLMRAGQLTPEKLTCLDRVRPKQDAREVIVCLMSKRR